VPKVSIVLPSYNRAQYLSEAIESCLRQSFKDFELIIIDDNSNDDSFAIAQKYAIQDPRITTIRNKSNQRLPRNLNLAFSIAQGDYFTWISDDNLFLDNALEVMANYLDNMPEIGLVYADYHLINAQGAVSARIFQEDPEFLPIRDCVGACFLYRADIGEQVGTYDEEMILVEDYDYWLRLGLISKLYHIPEPLYLYRTHDGSLTKTRQEEIRQKKLTLKRKYLKRYKIPKHIKPILDLYQWFIGDKNLKSSMKLLATVVKNPIITLKYIYKNLPRLR
jgi:glycosyltransferase involved in cell wall biosynthesis